MDIITKTEAKDAARSAAFQVHDLHFGDRTVIHTMAGMFGADWDLAGALEFIDNAEQVGWVSSLFGHDLVAVGEGRRIAFDARKPRLAETTA